MDEKKNVAYSIGLDIGTSSVGWAVVDENTKLLKKGKNHLWGYDIFPSANTAKQRRLQRGARRRYTRRRQRIHLLQDFCTPMIAPVDPLFFKRLDNSYLVAEDHLGDLNTESILFVNGGLSDQKVYEEYPTIYHLRHELMNKTDKCDPRLVYLALHHIVKYRGNFLYEGQSFQDLAKESDIQNRLHDIFEYLQEQHGWELDCVSIEQYVRILDSSELRGKEKIEEVKKLVPSQKVEKVKKSRKGITVDDEEKVLVAITKLIIGYKGDLGLIFKHEFDPKTKGSLKFSDKDIEDKLQTLEAILGDDYDILMEIQSIYSYFVLQDILRESKDQTISSAMISLYEKHQRDLELLKKALKNDEKAKKTILGKGGSYDLYVNHSKDKSQDDLIKDIKEVLAGNSSVAALKILEENDENFLPKQRTSKNGAIPYQLHENELIQIVKNQGKYYPCLLENLSKLQQLVNFRIPYYVGPLNTDATNAWLVLNDENDHEAIRPWNLEEKIDVEKTAELFIRRMTNHCTYLLAEDAMPKNSIAYGRFNLYNELNKVRINGELKFKDCRLKDRVVNDLFLKNDTVTEAKLINYLYGPQDNEENNDNEDKNIVDVTGLQGDKKFNSSLKVERDFRKIFGEEFDAHLEDIEKIIEYLSIYKDKKIIERRLRKEMPYLEEKGWLSAISNKRYSGFGNLSYRVVNELKCKGGQEQTILELMENTTMNFMQILHKPKYGFEDIIKRENETYFEEHQVSYRNQVDELAGSPAIKRGIIQSIRIVEDIVKYFGKEPKEIFIEFAREEGEKTRTKSRKTQLKKKFNDKEKKDLPDELLAKLRAELNEASESDLQDERKYLYFLQAGKCLYSQETLVYANLQKYQVDHILPQCYIKDDSIENKALVKSSENQHKGDSLLLGGEKIEANRGFWRCLKEHGLMSEKKFYNLTRYAISDGEKVGFIARQLVETRQISVHVKNILQSMYKETDVLTVHASLSSEYRHREELYKIRGLNHAHHAQDAYLACLIGQFVNHKYPCIKFGEKLEFDAVKDDITSRKEQATAESEKKKSLEGFIVNQMNANKKIDRETGEVFWSGQEQLDYVQKIFGFKDYFYNYQARDNDGKLFNATIYSAGDKNAKVPMKNDMDVEKYGGYGSLETACGIVIKGLKKSGKKVKQEEVVMTLPVMYANLDDEEIKQYAKDTLSLEQVVGVGRRIMLGQTFIVDGCLYSMSSATEWRLREPIFVDDRYKKALYAVDHKYVDVTEGDLAEALLELLKKTYQRIPTLRNKVARVISFNSGVEENKCKKMNLFDDSEESNEVLGMARVKLSKLGKKELKIAISDLMTNLTSSSCDLRIGDYPPIKSFARMKNKTLYLNESAFVFTSPSGIYIKKTKGTDL